VRGLIPVSRTPIKGYNQPVSIETNATTTEQNDEFDIDFLGFIINDGDENITFNFNQGTSSEGSFTLEPGEYREDEQIRADKLYYKAASGTQAFRAWGWR
jgi:hypothetical protein